MPIQLTLDFIEKMSFAKRSVNANSTWIDVSEIARGVGFTETVQVYIALIDMLTPLQSELDGHFDQRLYDALWRAHLELALDDLPSATFNFSFTQKFGRIDEMQEIRLYLHAEKKDNTVYLGRLEDF